MDPQGNYLLEPFFRPRSKVELDIQKLDESIKEMEQQIKLQTERKLMMDKSEEVKLGNNRIMQLKRKKNKYNRHKGVLEIELKHCTARENFQAVIKKILSPSDDLEKVTRECEVQLYGFTDGFDGHKLLVKLLDALRVPPEQREKILKDAYFKMGEELNSLQRKKHVDETEDK